MQKKENSLGLTLSYLEDLIRSKKNSSNSSYTTKLIKGDINKVIQKVGEESTEVIIEATLKNKERYDYTVIVSIEKKKEIINSIISRWLLVYHNIKNKKIK